MNPSLLFLLLPGPAPLHAAEVDPQGAVDHIDAWMAVSNAAVQLPLQDPEHPGKAAPALVELEAQAAALPRWPEQDPVADAVMEMLAGLRHLSEKVYPDLDALMGEMAPRAVHLEQAEAAFEEIDAVRYGRANAVRQAMHDFGSAQNVNMGELLLLEMPAPTGAALPGGASIVPESYRQNFAQRHVGEVRGVCNEGVVLMNQALDLASRPDQDLAPLAPQMETLQERMAEIPAWVGDPSFRDSCAVVLQSQAELLQTEVPAMRAAFVGGDLDGFNAQSRAVTSALRGLQVDLFDHEATFRRSWGLEVGAGPPSASEQEDSGVLPAVDRQRHWTGLVNQAVLLGTRFRIALLLGEVEYDTELRAVQKELEQLQAQAESPPPFDGEDTLRRPAIAVLDVIEQSFGDWGPRSSELLELPNPRAAHQEAFLALRQEETQALDKALAEFNVAHQAFSETHDIRLIKGQSVLSLPQPVLKVTLPGPEVPLDPQVRIAFASRHQREVNEAFLMGFEAWKGLMEMEQSEWSQALPGVLEVVQSSLDVVQAIPPWMGDETLVASGVASLQVWVRHLQVTLPRLQVLAEDLSSERGVKQYNKNLKELNETSRAALDAWNGANETWQNDWHYGALETHNQAMVDWAQESRTLMGD